MLEVLGADFVRTARAKGLAECAVIVNHAMRLGVLPVVSYIRARGPHIVMGSIVVEQVFAIPGSALPRERRVQPRLRTVLGSCSSTRRSCSGAQPGRGRRVRGLIHAWSCRERRQPASARHGARRRTRRARCAACGPTRVASPAPQPRRGGAGAFLLVTCALAAARAVAAVGAGPAAQGPRAARRPRGRTGSAPTTWAATCSRACCTADASRCSSARRHAREPRGRRRRGGASRATPAAAWTKR